MGGSSYARCQTFWLSLGPSSLLSRWPIAGDSHHLRISRSTLLAGGVFIVALLKTTGVLMEPLVRVSEVDQAITDVKAAYQDALKAPNRLLTPAVPAVCAPAPAAS